MKRLLILNFLLVSFLVTMRCGTIYTAEDSPSAVFTPMAPHDDSRRVFSFVISKKPGDNPVQGGCAEGLLSPPAKYGQKPDNYGAIRFQTEGEPPLSPGQYEWAVAVEALHIGSGTPPCLVDATHLNGMINRKPVGCCICCRRCCTCSKLCVIL